MKKNETKMSCSNDFKIFQGCFYSDFHKKVYCLPPDERANFFTVQDKKGNTYLSPEQRLVVVTVISLGVF